MDVEPFLVASAVDCVVAQRLGRRLCESCKEPYEPTDAELETAGFPEETWSQIEVLYRSTGCTRCSKTGFKGRLGLYEIMLMSEDIERMTAERRSAEDIRRMAIEQGMVTLRGDGLGKARAGMTSLDEVFRVVV
jgi:type IV pilus assembly protein PilB